MPTIEAIRREAELLGEKYGADRIYLFGSYAKGTASEQSDIDLRIDRGAIHTLIRLSGLRIAFEEALGLPVDLLPTDSLDPRFLEKIRPEEVLLYARE